MREGRAVNIHMFCPRRPGLLLNAMKAIEGLGLDVQQAVASCFNGFTLDVFKAEVIYNCTYFSPNCEKLAFCHKKKNAVKIIMLKLSCSNCLKFALKITYFRMKIH